MSLESSPAGTNSNSLFSADRIAANAIKDAEADNKAITTATTNADNEGEKNLTHSFRGSVRNLRDSIRNIFFDWGVKPDAEIQQLEDEAKKEEILSTDHIIQNSMKEAKDGKEKEKEEEEDDVGQDHFKKMKNAPDTKNEDKSAADDSKNMHGSFKRLSGSTRKGWFDW